MVPNSVKERNVWLQSCKIKCALLREPRDKYKYDFISSRRYARLITNKVFQKLLKPYDAEKFKKPLPKFQPLFI